MNRAEISAAAQNERDLKDRVTCKKRYRASLHDILERQTLVQLKILALKLHGAPKSTVLRRALYSRVRAEICSAATKGTP